MKNNFLITVFILFSLVCSSQTDITWQDLAKVSYTEKFFPAYDGHFLYPSFGKGIKDLEGKKVSIVGYFLNIDPKGKLLILSKNPMASCFFCGMGGPETAVELQFDSKPDYKTDDVILVTGTLKLNKDDVEHFNYILTDCEALYMK